MHRTLWRWKEARQYDRQAAMSVTRSIQYNAPAPVRPKPGTKRTVAITGIGTSPTRWKTSRQFRTSAFSADNRAS
jgi:hypothetical protein